MKFSAPLTMQLLAIGAHASPNILLQAASASDSDSDYILSVCSPATPPDQAEPAPCVAIQNIETACLPNGTSPLALDAHAQCLCGGSYFAEWLGCRRCLLTHGALSPRNFTYFSAVLSSASAELCTGTPTAAFATLFTQAQAGVPEPTTGGTQLSDAKSGDAAVSLYYTASGPQGPGKITGSATAATAEVSKTEAGTTATATGEEGSQGGSGGAGSASGGPAATTSTSSNVGIPTGAPGNGKGAMIAAAVGGALVAVL